MPESKVVLVISATGKQGSGVCDALIAKQHFKVFGTTRSGTSAKLAAKGVSAVPFRYGDAASAENAIRTSGASMVWFTTLMAKRKSTEVGHGIIIVDACKKLGVEFVVYSSVADCDKCPDNVTHFKSKLDVEAHLKKSGLAFSIVRPVAFLENFDDPANWNPLKKGSVKGLWPATVKVKLVACADIGKASAAMLADPHHWRGKTLDCASCECDGAQLATALTAASGVPSKYSTAMPRFALYLFLPDLYHMVQFFETKGYSSSIEEFKKVVPEAMGAKQWFASRGQWAGGEKFKTEHEHV